MTTKQPSPPPEMIASARLAKNSVKGGSPELMEGYVADSLTLHTEQVLDDNRLIGRLAGVSHEHGATAPVIAMAERAEHRPTNWEQLKSVLGLQYSAIEAILGKHRARSRDGQ